MGLARAARGEAVDVEQATSITVCPQGPLLVRGEFAIEDADGNALSGDRKTVALCRCGKSAIKPFCDGTHKLVNFERPNSGSPLPSSRDRKGPAE